MQAERGPAGNRCRMGVTVEKAERAGVESSHARRFRNFVGRSLVPKSPVLLSLRNYILLTPPVFALRFHLRRLYWRLTGHKLQQLVKGQGVESGFVAEKVLPYNLGNINIINRGRTERVIAILRSIRGLKLGASRRLVRKKVAPLPAVTFASTMIARIASGSHRSTR